MLRIALVDDDKESLALLKGYITDFCRENGECAHVECFNDGFKRSNGHKNLKLRIKAV